MFALIVLALPLTSFAGEYSGKVNKIKVNQKERTLTFELEDSDASVCSSAWYWIKRPNSAGASAAELVAQSYFNKGQVTVVSGEDCPSSSNPAQAVEISVGVSKDERTAQALKFHEKIKTVKPKNN